MDKPDTDLYYYDGRIDPDKAFNFVLERTRTMESEEFVRLMSKALEVRLEDCEDEPASRDCRMCNGLDSVGVHFIFPFQARYSARYSTKSGFRRK